MKKRNIERRVLIDSPSDEDQFHGKGHDRTADALARAIELFYAEDRAIGLDGPWGSGKSSVVEIADRKLRETEIDRKIRFHFFTYDIWKSQGSSFRRSFLEHFLDWAEDEFPKKRSNLSKVEKKVRGRVRDIESKNQTILDWYGAIIILLLPLLPIYYFWAKSVFDDLSEWGTPIYCYFISKPMILLYIFLSATFFRAGLRHMENRKNNKNSAFILALSQTILISAKQYEGQKITQHIRETDPNDFEFQSIIREILHIIQADSDRVVVVLDNIDRLPPEEIEDHWAMVRSVFSRGPIARRTNERSTITAIIPYDRNLIVENEEEVVSDISLLNSREIFSKTFDEVLMIAPPVMSNSREFFHEKIKQALPSLKDEDELFRVYLIFIKIIEAGHGTTTPRQIISFINDLTGLYLLHYGEFKLPTIAVFIAYRDHLEGNPTRLKDGSFIEDKFRTLAADKDLDRNLAAIIFNVEPDLAFQILLDKEIKEAATSQDTEKLVALTNSPGFDLRVGDVVEENMSGWISSDEYGIVVRNFSILMEEYTGNPIKNVARNIVESVFSISRIGHKHQSYILYLYLFRICGKEEMRGVARHIIAAVLGDVNAVKEIGYQEGVDLTIFFGHLQDALTLSNEPYLLKEVVSTFSLPSMVEFIFGFAFSIHGNRISLSDFSKVRISIPEDDESYLENTAYEYPNEAISAFAEFKSASLLSDDQWKSIADRLLQSLVETGAAADSEFGDRLRLLADIYIYTSDKKRPEIELDKCFRESQFFENLFEKYAEDYDEGLASALFLAGQGYLENGLSIPFRMQPNGQEVQHDSAEFNWFKEYFTGDRLLEVNQYGAIATRLKEARKITIWLAVGRNRSSDLFIANVIKSAFLVDDLPRISLTVLMESYFYLKSVLDNEFRDMLERYASRLDDNAISSIKLNICPIGLQTDLIGIKAANWQKFNDRIGQLLSAIPAEQWEGHLSGADHIVRLLIEKAGSTGFLFPTPKFKDVFVNFILKLIGGEIAVDAAGVNYDQILNVINSSYHADIFRKIRESMRNVSAESLKETSEAFPIFLEELISSGERITKREKDNVVREILCSALEGDNRQVLRAFQNLGRTKVAEFIRQSEESTRAKKEGAWITFSESCTDRDWQRQMAELILGKRKAKSWLDLLFGTSSEADTEDSEGS